MFNLCSNETLRFEEALEAVITYYGEEIWNAKRAFINLRLSDKSDLGYMVRRRYEEAMRSLALLFELPGAEVVYAEYVNVLGYPCWKCGECFSVAKPVYGVDIPHREVNLDELRDADMEAF